MRVARQERTLAIDGVYVHVCLLFLARFSFCRLIIILDNAIEQSQGSL